MVSISLIESVLSVLVMYTSISDSFFTYCAFLISLICILQWIAVFSKSISPPTEFVRALQMFFL